MHSHPYFREFSVFNVYLIPLREQELVHSVCPAKQDKGETKCPFKGIETKFLTFTYEKRKTEASHWTNQREFVSFTFRRTSEFATVQAAVVFYDSRERKREGGKKSGFCGRVLAARNARGPSTATLSPSSLRYRERPVKSGISGRRKVFRRYLTWFYDRCLYGFSFLPSLPHSHSLLFSSCSAEGTLPLIAGLSFSRPFYLFCSFVLLRSVASLGADLTRKIDEEEDWRRIPLHIRRCRSEDLSCTSASSLLVVSTDRSELERSWILRRLKIIHERHLRRLNTLMPPCKLICYTKASSRHFSSYEDVLYRYSV